MLQGLLEDVRIIEAEYEGEGIPKPELSVETETMEQRVDWAIDFLKSNQADLDLLLEHFHTTLNEVRNINLFPFTCRSDPHFSFHRITTWINDEEGLKLIFIKIPTT
jgi:hypothetical protein